MANRRKFLKGLGAAALLPVLPSFAMAANNDKQKKSHRLLTANIRVALDEDVAKGVGWPQRKDICLQIIKNKKPDIIALQEVLKVQAEDFRQYFKTFQLLGYDGPEMDEHATGYHGIAKNPILFSKERYELLSAGVYWLSETPLLAGSKSWDTARARHANWVRLRERSTGKDFRVVNLHLDHVSEDAKIRQLKMVVDESAQYQPDFPQVLAGDFNARRESNVFQSIKAANWKEAYETIHGEVEAGYTTHEFNGENYPKGASKGRIDFIWYRGNVKPLEATIIKDAVGGKYPSDHYFLQTDLIIE